MTLKLGLISCCHGLNVSETYKIGTNTLEYIGYWNDRMADFQPDCCIEMGDKNNAGINKATTIGYIETVAAAFDPGCPMYHVRGNHELDLGVSESEYKTACGIDYINKSWTQGDYQLIIIDAQDGSVAGAVSNDTLTWLENELTNATKPCIVFLHQSPIDYPEVNWDLLSNHADFRALLESYNVLACFYGHVHRLKKWNVVNGVAYIPIASLVDARNSGDWVGNGTWAEVTITDEWIDIVYRKVTGDVRFEQRYDINKQYFTWIKEKIESGWLSYKEGQLTRESGTTSSFIKRLYVGESAGSANADVHCDGECKSDFSDLRFTNESNQLLPYFIESISGVTLNQTAMVWIRTDYVGTEATPFKLWYNNPNAVSASSGENTFPFFDDFLGESLDATKWSIASGSTINVSESTLTVTGRSRANSIVTGKTFFGQGYEVRALVKTAHYDSTSYREFGGWRETATSVTFINTVASHATDPGSHWQSVAPSANGKSDIVGGIEANKASIWSIARASGVGVTYGINDNPDYVVSITSNYPTINLAPNFEAGTSTDAIITIYWVAVKPYLVVEPVWGTWGEAQTVSAGNKAAMLMYW